jgi:hypothetical protein
MVNGGKRTVHCSLFAVHCSFATLQVGFARGQKCLATLQVGFVSLQKPSGRQIVWLGV